MSSPAEISGPSPHATGASPAGARWLWFPLAWPATLGMICILLRRSDADPGLVNTAIHLAIALTVFGLAAWMILASGLRWIFRYSLALIPLGLVTTYYLQLWPIETINNGDVAVVGWRWRWADPDRSLDVPDAAGAPQLDWRETAQDYPAFLGGGYWAEVRGVNLDLQWDQRPPRLLWKQEIGAGWSGFAVVGDYAVTQEQRGDQELVACYELKTGKIAWTHADAVRWDPRGSGALGGIGPRATPTIHGGRVFAHGATGILNCLDARTGKLLWTHDTLAEHRAKNVMWGKAGSPLIVDEWVVVSVGGAGASLVAYDMASGDEMWAAGDRQSSYATPVLATLAGVRQILSVNEGYVTAHRAEDGAKLWEHLWPSSSDAKAAAAQPVPLGDDRVLLTKGYGLGGEVIQVTRDDDKYATSTVWKNQAVLKNKMSNILVRDGYAYGLNDVMLQCVDLANGKAKWTKRRRPAFGHGQTMLVGEVIVGLSEEGELMLVEASPQKYRELASLPALEGVTWNNPALSGPYLLVRNGEQAACFELPLRPSAVATRHNDSGPSR